MGGLPDWAGPIATAIGLGLAAFVGKVVKDRQPAVSGPNGGGMADVWKRLSKLEGIVGVLVDGLEVLLPHIPDGLSDYERAKVEAAQRAIAAQHAEDDPA